MFPPFVMAMSGTITKLIAVVKMYYKYLSHKGNDAKEAPFPKGFTMSNEGVKLSNFNRYSFWCRDLWLFYRYSQNSLLILG